MAGAAAAVALLVAGVGVLLLVAAGPAGADDHESISTYDTRLQVQADGTLRVQESIRYDFGANPRHGIIRTIPVRFRYDDDRDRVYEISDVAATVDGAPVEVAGDAADGAESLRLGDPDQTITGAHTYVIHYLVRGALNHFADHEELYWNVVGDAWAVPIAAATATVSGPVSISNTLCFAGATGSQLGCTGHAVSGGIATFHQVNIGNGAGLTVVVGFPAGSVANTSPILVDRHDLTAAFQPTPATIGVGSGLALLGVGAALLLAFRVGRDRYYVGQLPGLVPTAREPSVQERKPLLRAPPVSVEFGPPEHIRPGQVGTLIDEKANVHDVTATIVDFAVRRHLHIREVADTSPTDWELTKLTDGDPDFLSYERYLFDALFAHRDRVRLADLKNTFTAQLHEVQRRLYANMVDERWYRQSPATTRAVARVAAVVVLILAAGVTALLAATTHAALIGVGLVVAAIVLLVMAGTFPARTGRGSAMLARVQGFRLYIATAEAEQMKFQEREQIFSEFLPYAIVFGLADRWAGIFAKLGADAMPSGAGSGTPGLYWYTGSPGWTILAFSQSIGAFTTTTTGTVASSPPSASGSSGFSGGFAGGGGGGGGGGSW